MTTTRTSWARFDQPRLLTGNLYTGSGPEIDRRIARLGAEAGHRAPAAVASPPGSRGLRRRVGHGLVHLGAVIQGVEAAGW